MRGFLVGLVLLCLCSPEGFAQRAQEKDSLRPGRVPRATTGTVQGGVRNSGRNDMPSGVAPDNTAINRRDRNGGLPTAGEQEENTTDLEITQKIRRAVLEDDSLSIYAQNVKIVTQNGMVTLRGPVRSEAESKSIEQKAASVAGPEKVRNEIEVMPAQER